MVHAACGHSGGAITTHWNLISSEAQSANLYALVYRKPHWSPDLADEGTPSEFQMAGLQVAFKPPLNRNLHLNREEHSKAHDPKVADASHITVEHPGSKKPGSCCIACRCIHVEEGVDKGPPWLYFGTVVGQADIFIQKEPILVEQICPRAYIAEDCTRRSWDSKGAKTRLVSCTEAETQRCIYRTNLT